MLKIWRLFDRLIDCDIEFIQDDIDDKEQSTLLDFCRDKLGGKEEVYNILEQVMNGDTLQNSTVMVCFLSCFICLKI